MGLKYMTIPINPGSAFPGKPQKREAERLLFL